ncbi:MAG: hypothetical protein MUP11_07580 [Anaerolineales bacterium]|nr:hypothetical protein [Anaerolineales bacterium]
MFTTDIVTYKTQQEELHRQAEHYRLVRSLEQPNQWIVKIFAAVGRMFILFGQQLIKRTQAAH